MDSFPTFLSYSALKLYGIGPEDDSGCPYAFYLRYKEKRKPAQYNCRNFFVGHVCHSCEEHWIKAGMTPGTIRNFTTTFRDAYLKENTVVYTSLDDQKVLFDRIEEYAEAIEKAFFDLGWDKKKWQTEVSVKVWDNFLKCFFYCRLDLLDTERMVAADLKVTKSSQYFDRVQGEFACLLMSKQYRKPITEFIQFTPLMKKPTLTYFVGAEERTKLYNKIKYSVLNMRAGNFEAKAEKSKCYRCELAEFCTKKYSDKNPLNFVEKDGKRKIRFDHE